MLATTTQELEQIRNECRLMVNNGVLSGGAAIIPVPGVDIANDVGLLLKLQPKISRRFGLSLEQIEQLDYQTKMVIANLIIRLGTQLVGQVLTKQLIMQILKTVGIRMTMKQVVKYIPFARQAAAAGLSFAVMPYVSNSHVDKCCEVVKGVIEKKAFSIA